MQIRCTNCHKPFSLSKEEVHAALDILLAEDQHHFNVHCKHCGKINRVSRQELQRSAPDWKPNQPPSEPQIEEAQED
jgi:RNase P subunit RPR2